MDDKRYSRRDFMTLAAAGGGLVFASSLPGCATLSEQKDFSFVQLSDVHWGYGNLKVNPDARATLNRAVAAVNGMEQKPDFVVFTGDLTQTTDDPKLRRQRLREFKDMVAALNVPQVRFFPGEHDASLDRGAAYQEVIGGPFNYTFEHKGVHFIVLDNVTDPGAILGAAQIAWLKDDLARLDKGAPIVVLTHRPLFPLSPQWDWATRDGAAAIELLMPYRNVTVFYGHIHHEHHHATGHIQHHAAMSCMFPLSPVGTAPQKTQLPWDPQAPWKGLGLRSVNVSGSGAVPKDISLKA